jgi:hypothetical protein
MRCMPWIAPLLFTTGGALQPMCPSGAYYLPHHGCVQCKRGMYSKEKGAVSAKACKNCASGTYAVNASSCEACPPNTISPAGAFGIMECSPQTGFYASAGVAGVECPANFYCVQGTTRPTPCPAGTSSPPRAARCTQGGVRFQLLNWIVVISWILLISSGVAGLGLFKHASNTQTTPLQTIRIQVNR